jgi:hypothetical protein
MAFPSVNEPINKLKGYKALVYLGDEIVLARLNKLYVADLRLEKIRHVCTVGKLSGIIGYLSRFRFIQRLLRLEMGPATPLEEFGCFLVFYRNQVYHVDIKRLVAKPEIVPSLIKKPLQMLLIKSGVHKGSVLFGDYQLNAEYGPVNIYRRDRKGVWDFAFVFPQGEINHVHGIIEDARSECFYILTGDFGKGACIWTADLALKEVRPLVRSGQMSRACWLMPWSGRLVFATDQQANFNYLCTIDVGENVRVKQLFPIVGSSIYFSNTHTDPIVFSTAVEPKSTNGVTLMSLMSTRRADGILSDEACVYMGTPTHGFEIIFSGKKDHLPFGLFQFGNISFPSGTSSDQMYVHFYCSALIGHDGTTYVMKLKPND